MSTSQPRVSLIGCVCLLLLLAGCAGFPPSDSTPSASPPTEAATESPTATPPAATDTDRPSSETIAPEGLLIVDVVENQSTVNESEVVAYDGTIVGEAPTLADAIAEAISTNSTQTENLSSQEVDRVEAVAEAYDVPTGGFVVSKDGTLVRVSLGYEA